MFIAKTNPIESIKEHTNMLLKNFENFKKINYSKIDKSIFDDTMWRLLEIACKYHDVGKANLLFQRKLYEALKKDGEENLFEFEQEVIDYKGNEEEINHNYLSIISIPYEKYLNKEEFKTYSKLLGMAVGFHHERINVPKADELIEYFNNFFVPFKDKIEKEMNVEINTTISKRLLNYILNRDIPFINPENIKESSDIFLKYSILTGILRRIDCSASAHSITEEPLMIPVSNYVLDFFKKNGYSLNELQEFSLKNSNKNLIVKAQTGSGKTEACLLWAGENKCFITLPTRASINAIYDRVIDDEKIGFKQTALLHSGSIDHLKQKIKDDDLDYKKIHNEASLFSKPITMTTIDQILKYPFLFNGFETEYSLMSNSRVVIDEIQAYDPKITAMLIKALEMAYQVGSKFMIMTATLPPIYVDEIKSRGIIDINDTIIKDEPFLLKEKLYRHKIEMRDNGIVDNIPEIIEKAKTNKVLVIVNTVAKAIEVYNTIASEKEKEKVNVKMLHSRYKRKDKARLESEIRQFDEIKGATGIWITTQIVEASLDIDFDLLYTEISSLDSLFQRFGRCFRRRTITPDTPNIIISCEKPSDKGKVYESFIVKKSIELLKEHNGKIVDEYMKDKLINELYSRENLKGSTYLEIFKKAMNVFDSHMPFQGLGKREAQNMLRDISSIPVMDFKSYQNLKPEIDKLDTLNKEYKLADKKGQGEIKKEREKIWNLINDNIISVDYRAVVTNKENKILYECENFFVIEKWYKYDEKIGFDLKNLDTEGVFKDGGIFL